ncbi:hypothetical protein [Loktanella fryxellensis]|uniref:hypothetical protein n=1 Tax=Loktanella fryxellensis TaxID=245187 RepID=UPI00115FD8A3|nr:hypothetical protein [Loktanella fryxellensis]
MAAKTYPANCVIVGNPGVVLRANTTWANSLSEIAKLENAFIDADLRKRAKPPRKVKGVKAKLKAGLPALWTRQRPVSARLDAFRYVLAGFCGVGAFECIAILLR